MRMLAKRGEKTLADDGYEAFNAIANEDMTALTESIVRYAEQLTRKDTRVNELKACMEVIAIQP